MFKLPSQQEQLIDFLERRRAGDTDAAKRLMKFYIQAVRAGEQPDRRLQQYLAESFAKVADQALGIRLKKGRPGGVQRKTIETYVIVKRFQALHDEYGLSYGEYQSAPGIAAPYLGMRLEKVDKAYKRIQKNELYRAAA